MTTMPARNLKIMLDSGAFSAWRLGGEVNIKEYMEYIKRYGELFYSYVALDVIPGEKGKMDRSQAAIEKSAASSYKNLQIMKDAGLHPIPVFHQGERFEWLERMIADGEPYIGVSPYLRSNYGELIKWMDECFTRLCDAQGNPLAKTHGFGVTGHRAVMRYPWHTSDSTSWAIAPGYGLIKVPRIEDGKFDYKEPAIQVVVTDARPPSDVDAKHIDSLSSEGLDHVSAFLATCGLKVVDVRTRLDARREAYVTYMKGLEAAAGKRLFRHRRAQFGRATSIVRRAKFDYHLIFASLLNTAPQNHTLNKCGVDFRLLSYYELRTHAEDVLERYMKYGLIAVDDAYAFVQHRKIPKQKWSSEHYKEFRRYSLYKHAVLDERSELNERA